MSYQEVKNVEIRAMEMVQGVETLGLKPDNQSTTPGTHMMEAEDQTAPTHCPLASICTMFHTHTCAC